MSIGKLAQASKDITGLSLLLAGSFGHGKDPLLALLCHKEPAKPFSLSLLMTKMRLHKASVLGSAGQVGGLQGRPPGRHWLWAVPGRPGEEGRPPGHRAGAGRAGGQVSVLHYHWSRSNEARLSLVESFRVLLAPAVLCHKEPTRASKAPY